MTKKQHLINLNNEFDSNLLIKDIKNVKWQTNWPT